MCGIAGFIAAPNTLLPNCIIKEMTDIICHRGPDDEGFLLFSNNTTIWAGGRDTPKDVWDSEIEHTPVHDIKRSSEGYSSLALGHRRLAIQDLSPAGHQPLSYNNGRYWIIFNGEIYNHLEIRNELTGLGYSFKTDSDTETIIASYVAWGEDCQDKFVGMWSFVILDISKKELFLSRDRYGIKPLYYFFTPGGDFYFASEIKQFTVLKEWKAEMNLQRVYDQLVYSFTDHTDETMFKKVFQLPGGSCFKTSIDNVKLDQEGRIRFRKWYRLTRDVFKGSFQEASDIFRAYFDRAVKEHMHTEVPFGTALSGGLDSSSIVCTVNRILSTQGVQSLQNTFSSCSVYETHSEKRWIDIVRSHTDVNATMVYPDPEDIFRLARDLIWIHDEPYQSQSVFLGYHVFRAASESRVAVLLNGQGADEYLGGYGQFTAARYAAMFGRLNIRAMIRDIRQYSQYGSVSRQSIYRDIAEHELHGYFREWLRRFRVRTEGMKSLIDTEVMGFIPRHPFDDIPVKYRSVPEISEHLTFYSTLPKYLKWEDRNSMAHSIEARVPFLDHRLVEFAYSLPDLYLEQNGITKRVMREAMKEVLPEEVRLRKDKMGFVTPEEIWVKKDFTSQFREKTEEALDLANGILKPEVMTFFDEMAAGRRPFDTAYWRIILLGEWIDRFNIRS